MDKLDQKIIQELISNSRIPLTSLPTKLKVSREVVTYRLNKLQREGVILNFVTEINIHKLGYIGAAIFINIKARKHDEFKEFLSHTDFVSWVAELSGVWSFGFSIIAATNEQLDQKFDWIYNRFRNDIIDHRFTLHRTTSFFYEKYLGSMPKPSLKQKKIEYAIDHKDKIILQELAANSRINAVALTQKVHLTAPAVAKRIKHLEKSGYIQQYTLFINISKLGLFQYSIFIINKEREETEKLVAHLAQHPHVSFIAQYVGDPFLEFGLFVKDPYQLRGKLQEIEQLFPHNRIIEISLFQKEFVSVGPPSCVFE